MRVQPFAVTATLLSICISAHSRPLDCTKGDLSGPNHWACIDTKVVETQSWCLRTGGNDPKHIRKPIDALGADAFITEGKVTIMPKAPPQISANCKPIAGYQVPAFFDQKKGAWLLIEKDKKGEKTLQIVDPNGSYRFAAPLKLEEQAGSSHLFLNTNIDQFDWFIMLGDAKIANPDKPNIKEIEKYYLVEIFPDKNNNNFDPLTRAACDMERPDFKIGAAQEPPNFHTWNGTPADCPLAGHPNEVGQGGGGQNYP